jgi:hypothetical protein
LGLFTSVDGQLRAGEDDVTPSAELLDVARSTSTRRFTLWLGAIIARSDPLSSNCNRV